MSTDEGREVLDPEDRCHGSSSPDTCTGPTEEWGPCPYGQEIYGDEEFLCNCCSVCTQDCADDI